MQAAGCTLRPQKRLVGAVKSTNGSCLKRCCPVNVLEQHWLATCELVEISGVCCTGFGGTKMGSNHLAELSEKELGSGAHTEQSPDAT